MRHPGIRVDFRGFKVVNTIKPMRVPAEVERDGLDVPEFGMVAYQDLNRLLSCLEF